MGADLRGERVVLLMKSDHPWAGHAGEVIEDKGGGLVVMRLDNGQEVFAWPGQWTKAP